MHIARERERGRERERERESERERERDQGAIARADLGFVFEFGCPVVGLQGFRVKCRIPKP